MKFKTSIITVCTMAFLWFAASCGSDQSKSQIRKIDPPVQSTTEADANPTGIGPVSSVELAELDEAMAEKGKGIFETKCSACHKTDTKFIGPPLKDVDDRRDPAWIMNMILNPTEMTQKDPVAKQLLIEYNGSPMANQNLSQEEARAVLEYFRSI